MPGTALLKVDESGHILAAATNTGCAPRTIDQIYLIHTDGSLTPAPRLTVDDIEWRGNFTVPGKFQLQR